MVKPPNLNQTQVLINLYSNFYTPPNLSHATIPSADLWERTKEPDLHDVR